MHVALELRALQVRGLVGALELAAAQQLLGVQLAARAGAWPVPDVANRRRRAQPLAFYFHSSAPRRHTYTKATNSSTMNTIVSASAKLP